MKKLEYSVLAVSYCPASRAKMNVPHSILRGKRGQKEIQGILMPKNFLTYPSETMTAPLSRKFKCRNYQVRKFFCFFNI